MKTTVSIRLDKEVKVSAQEVAESVGLTLSALVNSYLTQVSVTRKIELYAPEQMSPKLEKLIEKAEKSINQGNVSKDFHNIDDFIADLDS